MLCEGDEGEAKWSRVRRSRRHGQVRGSLVGDIVVPRPDDVIAHTKFLGKKFSQSSQGRTRDEFFYKGCGMGQPETDRHGFSLFGAIELPN